MMDDELMVKMTSEDENGQSREKQERAGKAWSYWNEKEKRSEMKKDGESLEFKKLVENRMVHMHRNA